MARLEVDIRVASKSRGGRFSGSWLIVANGPSAIGRLGAAVAVPAGVRHDGDGRVSAVRDRWRPTTTARPTYTATAYVLERSQKAAHADRGAGETRVPVAFTTDDPRLAAKTANALADRYAANRRAEWQAATAGPCLKARQAADQSRQDYSESTARLARFERQLQEAAVRPKPTIQPTRPCRRE